MGVGGGHVIKIIGKVPKLTWEMCWSAAEIERTRRNLFSLWIVWIGNALPGAAE